MIQAFIKKNMNNNIQNKTFKAAQTFEKYDNL